MLVDGSVPERLGHMRKKRFGRGLLCCAVGAAVALSMTVPLEAAYAAGKAAGSIGIMGYCDEDGDVVKVAGTDGMAQLAQNVANGKTYAGMTVELVTDLDFEDYGAWTPIGSKEHPFCGSFVGYNSSATAEQTRTISALTVTGSSYLGLFGYIGAGGSVKGIKIDGGSVTATSSSEVIRNVGSIAGYVYGAVGSSCYAIRDCSSTAAVAVTSTMQPDESKDVADIAPDGDIPAGSTDGNRCFEYIGGLIGYCAGSITGCSYSGSLSVTTHEAPASTDKASMGCAVGGIVGQVGGYVTADKVTDDDEVSQKPHYPTSDGGDTTAPSAASAVSDCTNNAAITITVDGESGQDRFGESTKATMSAAGGIAGYAMASFSGCSNNGKIYASNESGAGGADGVGGIVGNLRSVIYSGFSSALSDAGAYKAKGADKSTRLAGPTLTVSKCTNSAEIVGLHAPGGIVGGAGTYTKIDQCANLKGANVYGVRWNKPMVGGIVGQTFGSVSYCYNRANVNSGLKGTGGGFYVAGIAGCLTIYEAESNKSESFDSPTSELYGCYSTGAVYAGGSFKQAGICGENEGYIHDCYYLYDKIASVSSLGDDKTAVAENFGTVDDATVEGLKDDSSKGIAAADLIKSKQYVAKFNNVAVIEDYSAGRHFVPAASEEQNDGNAVLAWQRTGAGETINESGLSYSGTGKASYSASTNPLPALSVSYDGSKLVEGADYYAVPDANVLGSNGKCRDISEIGTKTFKAAIIGIGDYSTNGSATTWTAPYTVGKANFSTCTVTIKSKVFNYLAQYPAQPTDADNSEVKIVDTSGTRVPADSFTMAADPGTCINYHRATAAEKKENGDKSYVGYRIKFTANENSNYTGDAYGIFAITKAHLIDSDKAAIESVTWNGQTWKFRWGSVSGGGKTSTGPYSVVNGQEVEGMTVAYCGESITPTINGYTYKDGNGIAHELTLGQDYYVVYGDPGDAKSLVSMDADNPNVNVGSKDSAVGSRPCFTLRFVAGDKCNFQNYHNVFFTITQADISKDCTVIYSSGKVWDSDSKVIVKSYTGKVLPASDYSVSTKLVNGKVKVTVSGKDGNVKGSVTKTFKRANTVTAKVGKKTLKAGAKLAKKLKKGKSLSLKVKKAKGKVTVKSSKKKVAAVKFNKKTGKLVIKAKKKGKAVITIKAAGNKKFEAGVIKLTLTVK